ncbi:putative asparagine synthase [Saccharomycopsis crataegensis]|uniref:Asparagine synthase n=1 Tax=Saccharomycopsis crataegensis TaxID=43959 RepID=A0AAV5QV54_9ASCO|nr:putative asparagine synthase [Saccharomycopsis crataegensis]
MCGILFHATRSSGTIDAKHIEISNEKSISEIITNDLAHDIGIAVAENETQTGTVKACSIAQNAGEIFECVDDNKIFKSLVPKILARGPNYASLMTHSISSPSSSINLRMFSSVLSLRAPFTSQPISDSRYILQFNGELYNEDLLENNVCNHNDTSYYSSKLAETLGTEEEVIKVIRLIKGEFSYVVVDKVENKVYFGKDSVGRRSLFHRIEDGELYVSSIYPHGESDWKDCEAGIIYVLNLNTADWNHLAETPRSIIEVTKTVSTGPESKTQDDIDYVAGFLEVFRKSIKDRMMTIEPFHFKDLGNEYVPPCDLTNAIYDQENSSVECTNAQFGILFSGGIDCTLIAGICGELLTKSCESTSPKPTIDLLNVSFNNRRTNLSYDATPDRKLGLRSYKSLQEMFPNVKYNFVEVNVSYEEYLKGKERVKKLMWPCNTEMDLSIAIAFYFASRGWGVVATENEGDSGAQQMKTYSNCKVLFSGLGADELFGGYSRHERMFQEGKDWVETPERYEQLAKELQKDIDGIWQRNLSRDDQVMSCWGKELRYPFLSEEVVKYGCEVVPLKWKVGDRIKKRILRETASCVGMEFIRDEGKRAIQFGAKSAKMEMGQGRTKGHDRLG